MLGDSTPAMLGLRDLANIETEQLTARGIVKEPYLVTSSVLSHRTTSQETVGDFATGLIMQRKT